MIFDDLYDEKSTATPHFNGRYYFGFNQFVDDRPYKANQNYDIGLKILTPNYDKLTIPPCVCSPDRGSCVIVVLPDNAGFLEEIRAALKIDKYLRLNIPIRLPSMSKIREAKKRESRERSQNALIFLEDALKDAVIYVNGDIIRSGSKGSQRAASPKHSASLFPLSIIAPLLDAAMSEANITQILRQTTHSSKSSWVRRLP
jgi:hypothetical protein